MSKQKILVVSVVLLIIINLATLSFMWFSKHHRGEHFKRKEAHSGEMILERRLKLNDEQVEAFSKAREEHFEKTDRIIASIHEQRRELNNAISTQQPESEVKEIISAIGKSTVQLEELNFTHMRQLRALCDENQQKKFDVLIRKILEKGPHFKKRKRRRSHGKGGH